jgi:hypothetical protein
MYYIMYVTYVCINVRMYVLMYVCNVMEWNGMECNGMEWNGMYVM